MFESSKSDVEQVGHDVPAESPIQTGQQYIDRFNNDLYQGVRHRARQMERQDLGDVEDRMNLYANYDDPDVFEFGVLGRQVVTIAKDGIGSAAENQEIRRWANHELNWMIGVGIAACLVSIAAFICRCIY